MKRKHLDLQEAIARLRSEMPRLSRDYGVQTLSLFGSYVRGEQSPKSDLDILVEFSKTPGMLKFMDLEHDLSKLLGVPVDLVHKKALKPAIGKRVLQHAVPI
ncbi:MAG: nucleotidyltransferase family protein [Desulfobulbaceae bacterium]|nr:nucleotidyltransferase family protein [Desulfobulbaceae bacterium]